MIRPDEYCHNLLKIAESLGLDRTVLLTPPYYNETEPTHYSKLSEVQLFRQALLDFASDNQLQVIDVFQAMFSVENPDRLLLRDALHFSEAGYEVLSEEIIKFIKKGGVKKRKLQMKILGKI